MHWLQFAGCILGQPTGALEYRGPTVAGDDALDDGSDVEDNDSDVEDDDSDNEDDEDGESWKPVPESLSSTRLASVAEILTWPAVPKGLVPWRDSLCVLGGITASAVSLVRQCGVVSIWPLTNDRSQKSIVQVRKLGLDQYEFDFETMPVRMPGWPFS